jgi:NAD+ synthase (glutamine-hydrolysing)
MSAVVGYVERNPSSVGKPFFNSAAVFQDGKQIHNYRKWLLPYYDIFEEERYFEAGSEMGVFQIQSHKIGVTICEDLWTEPGFLPREYRNQPVESLKSQSLDLLVNLSASPFQLGKREIREKLFQKVAQKIGAPVVFCNQVGANDELIFDGASFVVTGQGIQVQAKAFAEDHVQWVNPSTATASFEAKKAESDELIEALALGIRDYVNKTPAKTVCLGMSGGIDSSVVAALAVKALGSSRVFGYALPSRFNASQSLEDAKKLAQNLGISFKTLPIESIFEMFQKQLTQTLGQAPKTLTLENIQPRIRMTLLMALANEEGHLLLNTSNKSEIMAGYSTLYGDTAGALAVLGDLTKHQVYALAQAFNQGTEVIPERVILRPPSAELRENQTDQDTLPPYDQLDFVVEQHLEELAPIDGIKGHGLSSQTLAKVSKLNSVSEYKRRQFPPILRVTSKAFGMGRRIPIVGRKPSE